MHYMAQCMVMLAASGLPWCELAAVFSWDWDGIEKGRAALGKSREELLPTLITMGAVKVKTVRVERDPYALQSLVERLHQLRHTYLVNGVQPPPSSSGAYWEHLARNADGTRVATKPKSRSSGTTWSGSASTPQRATLSRPSKHRSGDSSPRTRPSSFARKGGTGGSPSPNAAVCCRLDCRRCLPRTTSRGLF